MPVRLWSRSCLAAVVCSWGTRRSAACSACGWGVRWRGAVGERVQQARWPDCTQSLRATFTLMT